MEINKAGEVQSRIVGELAQYRTEERKLEHLENLLKKEQDPDTRRIIFILMGSLQSQKKWYNNAARSFTNAADLAKTFEDKKDLFFKAGVMFVKSQDYFTAEDIFKKAVVLAKKVDKKVLQDKIMQVYLDFAKECENNRLLTKAMSIYNRILGQNIPMDQANQIRDKIAAIYDRMGRPTDANLIRAQKDSKTEAKERTEKIKASEPKEDDEFSIEDLLR